MIGYIMAKSNKGSAFERDVCRVLSLWWTHNERDDVFWRTSGSGARAKTRSKKEQQTFGQYGDVQATDPIGQPLIDLCTIELKRGYSNVDLTYILDKPENAKQQTYESFIEQVKTDYHNAKSKTWMLITKRDRRNTLVTIPFKFARQLSISKVALCTPKMFLSVKNEKGLTETYFVTDFSLFLNVISPEYLQDVLKKWK